MMLNRGDKVITKGDEPEPYMVGIYMGYEYFGGEEPIPLVADLEDGSEYYCLGPLFKYSKELVSAADKLTVEDQWKFFSGLSCHSLLIKGKDLTEGSIDNRIQKGCEHCSYLCLFDKPNGKYKIIFTPFPKRIRLFDDGRRCTVESEFLESKGIGCPSWKDDRGPAYWSEHLVKEYKSL